MKSYNSLLWCVLLSLAIQFCQGSEETSTKQAIQHHRFTRQISEECESTSSIASCTSGFSQRLVDFYSQCGDLGLAYSEYEKCTRRENGDFCIDPAEGLSNVPVERAFQACQSSFANSSCSMECQQTIQGLVPLLGCCINSLYNVSNTLISTASSRTRQYGQLFQNDLWKRCRVETVGTCSNYAEIRNVVVSDQQCFRGDNVRRLTNLYCNQANLQPFLNAIRRESEDCHNTIISRYITACEQNSNGEFCNDIRRLNQSQLTSAVDRHCDLRVTNCTTSCRVALMTFDSTFGCCVNNIEIIANITNARQLRDQCGLQLPVDMCISTIVAGAANVQATIALLLTALVVQLVATY